MNSKIPAGVGTVIIIIIAITAGLFVWKCESKKYKSIQQSQIANNNQLNINNLSKGEEFPTISIRPDLSLEEIIKQALFKKFPEWEIKNYSINTKVEINEENHAIGRFSYDNNKQGKYHNAAEGIWFAAKSDNNWTLVNISYAGYWGNCQDFQKYNFPTDMTPDCWDAEKNILNYTTNPQRFYEDGFTKADTSKIIQAFVVYAKKTKNSGSFVPENYFTKELYAHINKKVGNYISGTVLIGGSQNISAPEFLAVKQNGQWLVVHNGQDYPVCSSVKPYKFPREIVKACYDEIDKKEKEM